MVCMKFKAYKLEGGAVVPNSVFTDADPVRLVITYGPNWTSWEIRATINDKLLAASSQDLSYLEVSNV